MQPLPKKKENKGGMISVRLDEELLEQIKKEIKKREITLTQAVEYGLKTFLEASKKS